jgi:hypothetical protein
MVSSKEAIESLHDSYRKTIFATIELQEGRGVAACRTLRGIAEKYTEKES